VLVLVAEGVVGREAEYAKQYRMKRKLLMQQQTSTSSESRLAEKEKKAEYAKQYRLKSKLLIQQLAFTSSEIELRHINDSVLSSLKMEGIRFLYFHSVQQFKVECSLLELKLLEATVLRK
jgi:hypothetical protein